MKTTEKINAICIIPTVEDFDEWKNIGMTDAKNRKELLSRIYYWEKCTKIPIYAIEISVKDFMEVLEKYDEHIVPLEEPDADKQNSTMRARIASNLGEEIEEQQKFFPQKTYTRYKRKRMRRM